ncbi:Sirohydrochlorin cobaltochelatase [Sporomusa carbonis]
MSFCLAMIVGFASPSQAFAAPVKKAIVVVSFGTTFPEERRESIEAVENKIRAGFPEYEVRRAFTSKIVMKRMAETQNIQVDSLEQALEKLYKDGYKEVIVQSTHLTPGEEYDNKIVAVVHKYAKDFDKIVIGRPVLVYDGSNGTPDDFAIAVKALKSQMPLLQLHDRSVVFMGHGSPHQHNPAYGKLQQAFDTAGVHAVVGVVEEVDHPNYGDAVALLKERNIKRVILMPLMLVAGDHANNDMAGDEPDSWKNLLAADGFQVVDIYLHGLGANSEFQNIYVQHIKDAIEEKYVKSY